MIGTDVLGRGMVQWREWCGAGEVAPVPGDTGDASIGAGRVTGGGPIHGDGSGTDGAGLRGSVNRKIQNENMGQLRLLR